MFLTPAGRTLFVIAVLLLGTPGTSIFADGKGPRPRNSYLPADDVALGAEAATEIRANVPLINDAPLNAFIEELGRNLGGGRPARAR